MSSTANSAIISTVFPHLTKGCFIDVLIEGYWNPGTVNYLYDTDCGKTVECNILDRDDGTVVVVNGKEIDLRIELTDFTDTESVVQTAEFNGCFDSLSPGCEIDICKNKVWYKGVVTKWDVFCSGWEVAYSNGRVAYVSNNYMENVAKVGTRADVTATV